ncbi:hypothetical protein BSR28_01685 [Boudabousia liubingyangii]|uniref:hypothetical protein n=1 Tax=Boudabousia liubingyangii TaxID=1921764 RepID=UPI00093D71FE|nr:hypothetical protein [Boudabousia liubingyangii]OKL48439.1 hypothetical protein BSR28_01685 [Boudabousia liubingyangii]
MAYSSNTRVAHIMDIAYVPSTITRQARSHNRPWVVHNLPPVKFSPSGLASRFVDLKHWLRGRKAVDLVHVHYATNGYYLWGFDGPSVLHFHGSDARINSQQPGVRQVIEASIKAASAVVYATPDLGETLSTLAPKATYLPNPAPILPPGFVPEKAVPNRIVFNARWDDTKGGMKLVEAAKELVNYGFDVHSIDWGTYRQEARDAGVIMHPLMPMNDFASLLSTGSVVVGQFGFRALSISDMLTLKVGRPLMTIPLTGLYEDSFPLPGAELDTLAEQVADFATAKLDSVDSSVLTDWIDEQHGIESCLQTWEDLYRSIS